jgi:hypothetical protein
MHSVGFEPTHTNIFELESNSLDRSDMNASCRLLKVVMFIIVVALSRSKVCIYYRYKKNEPFPCSAKLVGNF